MHLDSLDVAILRALAEDVRRSLREVATLVGSTPTTVSVRLDNMKAAGLVQGGSLRLDPARTPGRARLLEGRVTRGQETEVLAQARGLPGVVEATVATDGRFMVILQILGLEDEERIVATLTEAGAADLRASTVQRTTGPPMVHLFKTAVDVLEACAVCGKQVGADALAEAIDGRRVVFCCTSCRRDYQDRYQRLKDAAIKGRDSTTS